MSKEKDKPKLKYLIAANKQAKLSVQLPQRTLDLIDDYRNFHKQVSGEEATLDALITAVINSSLMSDKSFIKWKRETAERNAKSQTEKSNEKVKSAAAIQQGILDLNAPAASPPEVNF